MFKNISKLTFLSKNILSINSTRSFHVSENMLDRTDKPN